MKIPHEIKSKIFALYFGQKIIKKSGEQNLLTVTGEILRNVWGLNNNIYSLNLRKIEDITDNEALEVGKILPGASHLSNESIIAQVRDLLSSPNIYTKVTNIAGMSWNHLFQYLASIGVALPYLEFSIKDLTEAKVYLFTENTEN